jgi:POT family proton-dependent oligopeptide transporter
MSSTIASSSDAAAVPDVPQDTLWGYPKGVYLLSFTELWERFSYYGMLSLLVLFLTATLEQGGFGWDRAHALKLYGFYTGLIFSAPLLGGWIANNFWGERRCILVGGILLVCGHACLSGPALVPWLASVAGAAGLTPTGVAFVRGAIAWTFFGGLALIVAGTALLKPTISSIIGRFFAADDPRREGAFAVFFVGIYIGSLAASLVVGFLGERVGWHWGFGAAGFGMSLGLVVYLWKQAPYLADIGLRPVGRVAGASRRQLTQQERDRIKVILLQGVFTVAYAAAFYQKGGLLTLFARERLDRNVGEWEIPVTWFLMVSTATFIIVVPVLARMWQRAGDRNPSASAKLAWGLMMLGLGYAVMFAATTIAEQSGSKAGWGSLVLTYIFFGIGDALVWPTQISLVSRLAPRELSAVFVGGWYITIGLGSWLTGYIGALGYTWGMGPLFGALMVAALGLGALLWAVTPRLRRFGHGVA